MTDPLITGYRQVLKGITGAFKRHRAAHAGVMRNGARCRACVCVYLFLVLAFLAYHFLNFVMWPSMPSLITPNDLCVKLWKKWINQRIES